MDEGRAGVREIVNLSSSSDEKYEEEESIICISSSDEDVAGTSSNLLPRLPSALAANTRLADLLRRSGTREPSGPSAYENKLLARLSEYGVTPLAFEVRMGGHQCDCIGVDRYGHLCVVEAKSMHQARRRAERGATSLGRRVRDNLRRKTYAQAEKYAKLLARHVRVDVTCYLFDDTGDLIGLQPHKQFLMNGKVRQFGATPLKVTPRRF